MAPGREPGPWPHRWRAARQRERAVGVGRVGSGLRLPGQAAGAWHRLDRPARAALEGRGVADRAGPEPARQRGESADWRQRFLARRRVGGWILRGAWTELLRCHARGDSALER